MIENTCRHGFTFLIFPLSVRPCPCLRKPTYALLGRTEIPTFGRQLTDLVTSLSDEERNELRETAVAVIDSCRTVEYFELTRLTAYMGFLRSLSQFEEENTEKDAERFRKLCSIYDDVQKRKPY